MPAWTLAVVVLAVFRVGLVLMLYVSGVASPMMRPPALLWVYAGLSSTYTIAGLALVLSQRRDDRAEWLGGLLTMVGCPLVRPLIAGDARLPFIWLPYLRPEVFTPTYAWAFAACFPSDISGRLARVVRGISSACVVIGFALVRTGAGHVGGLTPAAWKEWTWRSGRILRRSGRRRGSPPTLVRSAASWPRRPETTSSPLMSSRKPAIW